jgi:3-oxoacyl-[acyl-carrier protein] reductase
VRTILISGSRSGLGRGIAEHFAERGWRVYGCSRNEADWKHECYDHAVVDVGRARDVHAWVRRVDRQSGGLDAVIANAALVPPPRLAALGIDETFADVLRTNVLGAAAVMSSGAAVMLRRKRGRILAMSSFAAVALQAGTSQYAASKAAVETFARILAGELGATGVTCNVIAPSVYESEGLDMIGPGGRDTALAGLVVARPLQLKEVIAAIDYLLSDSAAAVTGQVLRFGTNRS